VGATGWRHVVGVEPPLPELPAAPCSALPATPAVAPTVELPALLDDAPAASPVDGASRCAFPAQASIDASRMRGARAFSRLVTLRKNSLLSRSRSVFHSSHEGIYSIGYSIFRAGHPLRSFRARIKAALPAPAPNCAKRLIFVSLLVMTVQLPLERGMIGQRVGSTGLIVPSEQFVSAWSS